MELSECPFCHAPKMIQQDGICPACKKNVFEATEQDLQYTRVEITANQAVPHCCIRCGNATDRMDEFMFRYDSHLGGDLEGESAMVFSMLTVFTAGFALMFLPMYRRHLQKYRELTYYIKLPFCEACMPHKSEYAPLTIEGAVFHFRAHKKFKEKLDEQISLYRRQYGRPSLD